MRINPATARKTQNVVAWVERFKVRWGQSIALIMFRMMLHRQPVSIEAAYVFKNVNKGNRQRIEEKD